MTKQDKAISILNKNHEGVSLYYLTKKLKCSIENIYSVVYALRKKGYNITTDNHVYAIKQNKLVKKPIAPAIIPNSLEVKPKTFEFTDDYIISKLSNIDRSQYFDSVEQAMVKLGLAQLIIDAHKKRLTKESEVLHVIEK